MKNKTLRFGAAVTAITILVSCGNKSTDEMESNEETTTPTEIVTAAPPPPSATTGEYDVTGKDTITTPSGLKYIMVTEGSGARPTPGKSVSVHYTGYLTDGTKFDSSVDRGEPIKFLLGTRQVIKGWDEGIALLNAGSKARLIIPHELGYGSQGYPPLIPADATLIFDVELVSAE